MATDVVQEQCEAEGDTSIQQRLMMGAATTIQGTGGALCEEGEGNQDMMIAGGMSSNNINYSYTRASTCTRSCVIATMCVHVL